MANGVTNEQRYALTARGRDTAEAGLIRKRDGTSWVVQPDGSEQQLPGGGGSQPGGFGSADFLFTEEATPGTYTASFPVAAKTVVFDVIWYGLGNPWAADDTRLSVGDTLNGPTAYFNNVGIGVGGSTNYDATDLSSGVNYDVVGDDGGDYFSAPYSQNAAAPGPGVRYAASDTIEMTVVTTIAVPPVSPTGALLVKIIYFTPATETAAVFA